MLAAPEYPHKIVPTGDVFSLALRKDKCWVLVIPVGSGFAVQEQDSAATSFCYRNLDDVTRGR